MGRLFRKLIAAERGSIIPLLAFALFSITGLVGVAVDSSRAYLVQSRMSTALDAAGLAAGATVNTTNAQEEAEKYMRANYAEGYVGSHLVSVTATPSSDKTVIKLSATATVPTVFMSMFGHDTMTVIVNSEITRTSKGMELALVLDVTGSMAGSKLEAAKTAAKDLLTILYGDRDTVDDLWVGLVPFSQAVNVGSGHTDWVDATFKNSLNWGTTSWAGCVEAREEDDHDTDDETPEDQPYKVYYWPDNNMRNDWVRVTAVPVYEEVCTTRYCGRGRNKYECGQNCRQEVTGYQDVTNYVIDGTHGPNKSCPQSITPLVASKATVSGNIDTLQAVGNTHIVLGAVWGWHLLSPDWRGLWGGDMDTNLLPLDYNTPLMNKVMVLMTDGDNTIDNSARGAYGYLNEGRLGTTDDDDAVDELDDRLKAVCTAMKSKNIIIYTVAFGSGVGSSTQQMLKDCATQPDYFFYSPTNDDLKKSFKLIGDSLANLRVSK